MFEILVSDLLRYSHLLAVAVGIGVAVETETYMYRRRRTKISPGMMTALEHRHRVILAALGVMWVTGLALVALRTGFQLSAFTPKLWAKITVVTLLTINAVFVSQVALPVMLSHIGKPIAALPRQAQSAIFSVAGISATSWLAALALGSSAFLKVASAPLFQSGLPVAYIAGIFAANYVGRRLFAGQTTPRTSRAAPTQKGVERIAPAPATQPVAAPATRQAAAPVSKPATTPSAPVRSKPEVPVAKPQRRPAPTPAVTVRASDLAIAFPQKLKRQPRMKPAQHEVARLQSASRADLRQIAAELGGRA